MRRQCLRVAMVVIASTFSVAHAQPYPSKPVRLVVPFPAGGGADITARTVAQALSQALGQPLVIDNRSGADGVIAGDMVKTSAPDGYTLLFATTTGMNAVPVMRKQPPYDPVTAFTPISLIGRFGFFLFVHESVPAKTVSEFLGYVRANPGKVNYGTGSGTGILYSAQLASTEKLEMHHIPYKGDGPVTTDLIAGRVQMMIGPPATAMPQVKEGRLRVLATLLPHRSPLAPEVPTATETGLGKLTINPWAGLFGPAKLSPEVVERLSSAMKIVSARSDVRESLNKLAFQLQNSTPGEMAAVLKEQLEAWQRTANEVGIEKN